MGLSTKSRYGTRALLEIARNSTSKPVKRKDISDTQNISYSYLENILISLKNAGIIETVRGAKGGFVLRKKPSEITLLEIVTALDGSLSTVECIESEDSCNKSAYCSSRMVWKKLADAHEDVLRNISMNDLIEYEDEHQKKIQLKS